jgi:heme/copper-type cytochrome/quinol oxidase subunit 2
MQMKIVVEEERDFNKWLEELRIAKKDVVRLSKEIEKLRIELAKK